MELQRVLAKDSRAAMDQVHKLYGQDALVISNKRAKNKTELIVAVDLKSGADEVYVFISHAVLSGDAAKKIKNSKIKKLVVTDTIDNSKKINNNNKIEVLSVSSLMSEAIKRIANSNSVSDLFN